LALVDGGTVWHNQIALRGTGWHGSHKEPLKVTVRASADNALSLCRLLFHIADDCLPTAIHMNMLDAD
jgi:hypothetical protein